MNEELLQRVALEQREYWKAIAKETGQRGISQQEPGDRGLAVVDPSSLTPADWQYFWGQFVAPELS
jgi:hypothetical protein